jgi:dTMP kinase
MIPAHQKYSGYFITFEGIDGSGKTVQCDRLAQFLKEKRYSVLLVRDPGGPAISEEIRRILLNVRNKRMASETELLLYEAARAQLVSETIIPALEAGKIVILDRFIDSTVAYQGYGRKLPLDWIEATNRIAAQNILPDRTYLLDLEREEALQRQKKEEKVSDRMESNQRVFFDDVRRGYREIARRNPERLVQLDGKKPVSVLEREIREDVMNILTS